MKLADGMGVFGTSQGFGMRGIGTLINVAMLSDGVRKTPWDVRPYVGGEELYVYGCRKGKDQEGKTVRQALVAKVMPCNDVVGRGGFCGVVFSLGQNVNAGDLPKIGKMLDEALDNVYICLNGGKGDPSNKRKNIPFEYPFEAHEIANVAPGSLENELLSINRERIQNTIAAPATDGRGGQKVYNNWSDFSRELISVLGGKNVSQYNNNAYGQQRGNPEKISKPEVASLINNI